MLIKLIVGSLEAYATLEEAWIKATLYAFAIIIVGGILWLLLFSLFTFLTMYIMYVLGADIDVNKVTFISFSITTLLITILLSLLVIRQYKKRKSQNK